MKLASTSVIALSIAAAGFLAAPAPAQKSSAAAAAQPEQWTPKITKEEAQLLQPIQAAVSAKDWATATAALPAAQAAVTSPDARYFLGQFQFQIGTGTNNAALQSQGLDAMVASGGGDPTKVATLYKNQAALAAQSGDMAKAEAAYARWAQLAPNDPQVQVTLAELKLRQKKPQEAFPILERAIAAQQAAGQPVPENWQLLALQAAIDAKMAPQAQALSRQMISTSPSPKNWRNALLIYRQNTSLDPALQLDMLRLMRVTKALDTSNEYLTLADRLARGRFYAEARDVVQEGRAAGKISSNDASSAEITKEVSPRITPDRAALLELEPRARAAANGELPLRVAEGYFGHGDFAKAADFYRLALQKGSVDANLVNTRLGIALARAGQRAEAEAAFKAVTGPRASLASYWLLWLNQRA